VRKRLDDPPVEITISLVTGYAAYLPAEELGVSGVLAAVTVGIYVGWRAPEIASANQRLLGFGLWEVLVFLLNALLFILVGLQLPRILEDLSGRSGVSLLGSAVVVGGIVIGVRMLWMHTVPYLIRAVDRRPSQRDRRSGWQARTVIGWSGMRGAVSLAAALALPRDFPERDLIVFLTFAVIFLTLVCQGLTLPPLIHRLGVCDDGEEEREELHARLESAKAALGRLDGLGAEEWTRDETVERMRGLYDYRLRRFSVRAGKLEDEDGIEDRSAAYQRMVHSVIDAQREALVRLRNEGVISNDVMHRLERELDLEEARLEI
jgi:NhaP-type Na+/H+ or K+/H+ antiporter